MRSVFGRVAQGVGGMAKGVFLGEAKAALGSTADDEAEVELQLQRVSDALMPEYRREAVGQLKDLLVDNPKAQLAVGNMGLPVLVAVLQEDRDDLDLVRGALECLVAAMAPCSHLPAQAGTQEAQAGAVNAELFARRPEHVQLLLNLLEDEPVGINDFYVRYHTVQLLTQLLQVCAYKLQSAILSSPMGVVRLMDMLAEREVIRNEALQLLGALTRANKEVQKIAAFEGAFDRVFTMLREEGGAEGGVVVQDCLELLNNLLRGNQANQRLFREMGFIAQLTQLLTSALATSSTATSANPDGLASEALDGPSGPSAAFAAAAAAASAAVTSAGLALQGATTVHITRQKAAILLCALESVLLLVAHPAPPDTSSAGAAPTPAAANGDAANRAATHAALLQAGVIEALLPMCLANGSVSSLAVRAQALRALGDVIAGHGPSQSKLAAASVIVRSSPASAGAGGSALLARAAAVASAASAPQPAPVPLPALQALLRVCLHAADAGERAAAEHVLHAYCAGNPDGQVSLVCSIAPAGGAANANGAAGGGSFGSELAAALAVTGAGAGSLQVSCRAAAILSHLLQGNPMAKQRLLTLPLELTSGSALPTELLLPRCVKHVLEALRVGGAAGCVAACLLLRLLAVWLQECPAAVQGLLDTAAHLPLLVDLCMGRHPASTAEVSGLAALLLGECLLYGGPAPGAPAPPPALGRPASPAALVLDVLLSRVGLSQFFARLDELMACRSFVAASVPPKPPKPVTRAAAAAATAADEADGMDVPGEPPAEESAFDYPFTVLVRGQAVAIKQAATQEFARPASTPASSTSQGSVEEVIASLPGASEGQKLLAAVTALRRAEGEAADVRARNRALAEDLMRLTAGGAVQGNHVQPPQPQKLPTQGGAPPQAAAAATAAAAEALAEARVATEAKVAAEQRAGRAEAEAAHYRQQLELLGARLTQAERDAVAAQDAAGNAYAAAAKHETDLQDLSAAYNSLEAHAHQLDAQVRDLTARLAAAAAQQPQQQQQQAAAGFTEEQVQERVKAAVESALQGAAANTGAAGGDSGDVERRMAEAAEAAKAEAEADMDEQLTDLLVCLGQEEAKVAMLREKLESFGVDVEGLLATIKAEAQEEEEGLQ